MCDIVVKDLIFAKTAGLSWQLRSKLLTEPCEVCIFYYSTVTYSSLIVEDFGFSLIVWVYSGRRGVHCWVCDSRVNLFLPLWIPSYTVGQARKLSVEGRTAIAEYLKVERPKQAETAISFTKLPLRMAPSLKYYHPLIPFASTLSYLS